MSGPEVSQLVSEILQALESDLDPPLTPLARKAARLARLRGEEEYRLLFELHIDGLEIGHKSRRLQKLPKGRKQQWDVVEAFNDDRTVGPEAVQGLPLERLEFYFNEARADLKSGDLPSSAIDKLLSTEESLGKVLAR